MSIEKSPGTPLLVSAIFRRVCPRCRKGKVYRYLFSLHKRCPVCDYDFYPEPGFYLGAMMVPFFFTSIATIPFAIYLKFSGIEVSDLLIRLACYYFAVASVLFYYSSVIWLHLEYRITGRLKQTDAGKGLRK